MGSPKNHKNNNKQETPHPQKKRKEKEKRHDILPPRKEVASYKLSDYTITLPKRQAKKCTDHLEKLVGKERESIYQLHRNHENY